MKLSGVHDRLKVLVSEGAMTPETYLRVVSVVDDEIGAWQDGVVAQLRNMISEWETTMGDEDNSFYSLGLRRAVDVVTGESALAQLPVLETPEYLPKDAD